MPILDIVMKIFSKNVMQKNFILLIYMYIPSPSTNIDTSVNTAFMADKLNTAKNYTLLTVDL